MSASGVPYWHMWGSTERLTITSVPVSPGVVTQLPTTQQLSRVSSRDGIDGSKNYGHPATYSFFFGARLTGGPVVPAAPLTVSVAFDVAFGVGLGKFSTHQPAIAPGTTQLDGFARLQFQIPAGDAPGNAPPKFTNVGRVVTDDINNVERIVEWIGACDIQCQARVLATNSASTSFSIELYSAFTPWGQKNVDT